MDGHYGDASTQQQFLNKGYYSHIDKVLEHQGMGDLGQSVSPNLYSHLNNAVGKQQPKAYYGTRGNVAGLGNMDPSLYSSLNKAVGTQDPRAYQGTRGNVAGLGSMNPALYANLYNVTGKKTLGGYLGQAATTVAPGLLVVAVAVAAYFLFFRKSGSSAESAPEPEPEIFGESVSEEVGELKPSARNRNKNRNHY